MSIRAKARRVAGHDPLERCERRAEIGGDRRESDEHDRAVDQVHEAGEQQWYEVSHRRASRLSVV